MALLITFLTGVSIIIGALVIKIVRDPERIEQISIALALGAMAAIAATDIIPEILEIFTEKSLVIPAVLVLAGIGLLKLLDLFIPEHDHDGHLSDAEAAHIGTISAVALVLHNIVEGMTVYSLSLTSLRQGAVVALAIGLHNIPMGMLIYSMLQRERRPVKYAVYIAVTLSTFVGGLILAVITAGISEAVLGGFMCVALGMILYIVLFELLPHTIKSRPRWLSATGVIVGIALVLFSSMLA